MGLKEVGAAEIIGIKVGVSRGMQAEVSASGKKELR